MKLAVVLFAILSSTVVRATAAEGTPTVEIRDGALFYDGTITKDGVAQAITLYENETNKPKLVAIRSDGGNGKAGLDFGEFIYKYRLSVQVLNYCLSSCANYVFVAGRTKYLNARSTVGWHGSFNRRAWPIAGTNQHIRCDSDDSCSAIVAKKTTDEQFKCHAQFVDDCHEQRAKFEAATKAGHIQLIARQRAFFESIGVDERVTDYGQEMQCDCAWTFSLDDMRRFNIQNISEGKQPHFFKSPWRTIRKESALKKAVIMLHLPVGFESNH